MSSIRIFEKLGFCLVAVKPDANGAGKPDIFMAKINEFKVYTPSVGWLGMFVKQINLIF